MRLVEVGRKLPAAHHITLRLEPARPGYASQPATAGKPKRFTVERFVLEIQMNPQLTYGQKAVGLTFNPSGDEAVTRCKQAFANAIDQMAELRDSSDNPEVKRMASIAITEAQTAQMWAVKAITWRG